jgi:hypothetical protein
MKKSTAVFFSPHNLKCITTIAHRNFKKQTAKEAGPQRTECTSLVNKHISSPKQFAGVSVFHKIPGNATFQSY